MSDCPPGYHVNFNICEVQLNICKTLPIILQLCITSPDFIIIILVLDTEHKKLALIFIVLQADILTMKHSCDVVIMMQTRHSDAWWHQVWHCQCRVAFIGNNSNIKNSEGGDVASMLFKRYLKGTLNQLFSLILKPIRSTCMNYQNIHSHNIHWLPMSSY